MKQLILCTLFFIVISVTGFAQISDDEARRLYEEAEQQYEAGNFYECYLLCKSLKEKMGKSNPKIQYLQIRAIYNNLEKMNDKSERTVRKSYKNYSIMSRYAEEFFGMVDKKTYPPEKYREIEEIARYFKEGMKKYEAEKDRTPADAIAFLNECGRKFKHRSDTQYESAFGSGGCTVNFSLDGNTLHIEVMATLASSNGRKYNQAGRERIRIDLSKVWIDDDSYKFSYHSGGAGYHKFFYNEFGNTIMYDVYQKRADEKFYEKDMDAVFIVGPTVYVDGKAKYDHINWYWDYNYDKNMEFPLEKFESSIKKSGYTKRSVGFYIYLFFDQKSDEFKDGKYRKRIHDAFEFLMEYFGGGVPVENKPEASKSKF